MPTLPNKKIESYRPPQLDNIIGLQCNLWTERKPHPADVLHRLSPRINTVAAKCLERRVEYVSCN